MEKILIMTDSACDIPAGQAQDLGIRVLPIPLAVDGKGYYDGVSFTYEEFYRVLHRCEKIPVTSHITTPQFLEEFSKADKAGYTHLVYVSINAKGSNMYEAACLAKNMFLEESPESRLVIEIIDSATYSLGYGLPLINAGKMVLERAAFDEVVKYLRDWLGSGEVYFSVFTLDFVKKSGRVRAAAAFVGEMLGLRPVISIKGGELVVENKIRGDKNVPKGLLEWAKKRMQNGSEYVLVYGEDVPPLQELAKLCEREFGYPPSGVYHAGASIAINAGPRVLGIAFTAK